MLKHQLNILQQDTCTKNDVFMSFIFKLQLQELLNMYIINEYANISEIISQQNLQIIILKISYFIQIVRRNFKISSLQFSGNLWVNI